MMYFRKETTSNCLILKINSFVFELRIYMCTYNQYYRAYFQSKCWQYSGSVLNVFIDDFTSLLRLPYGCHQKIRSVSYSCRKTSVRDPSKEISGVLFLDLPYESGGVRQHFWYSLVRNSCKYCSYRSVYALYT